MRIALLGQQKFGLAVLEAFLERGDTVAGVWCAPDAKGAAPDPLKSGADAHGVPVYQYPSLRPAAVREAMQGLDVDLAVMAYVLQFVPEELAATPKHGTIQYHPSLLPRYRGPSAINWPIIRGDTRTGLTIFRPTDGLDEGPIVLQKETPIGADDTLGSVYFERLFPMGVAALVEAADLVVGGQARFTVQDEAHGSYEGWCRSAAAQIHWQQHIDLVYNLIRGCDPSPGAWTSFNGKMLQVFEARAHRMRRFAEVAGPIGTIASIGPRSMLINAQGGQIEVGRVRYADGKKLHAADFCTEAGIAVGTLLGP